MQGQRQPGCATTYAGRDPSGGLPLTHLLHLRLGVVAAQHREHVLEGVKAGVAEARVHPSQRLVKRLPVKALRAALAAARATQRRGLAVLQASAGHNCVLVLTENPCLH